MSSSRQPSPSGFHFCIPLKSRSVSRDWEMIQGNLRRTVRSALAAAGDWPVTVDIACHEAPDLSDIVDPRVRVWPVPFDVPTGPDRGYVDQSAKFRHLGAAVGAAGADPGFIMFLDADDLVHHDLVRWVVTGGTDCYFVDDGYLLDLSAGVMQRRDSGFYRVCGSSFICRFDSGELPSGWEDRTSTFSLFHRPEEGFWHDRYPAFARQLAKSTAPLPHPAVIYLVNHLESHYTESRGSRRRVRLRDVRQIVGPRTAARVLAEDFHSADLAHVLAGPLSVASSVVSSAGGLAAGLARKALRTASSRRSRP